MPKCTQIGKYRGRVLAASIVTAKESESVGLSLTLGIEDYSWNGEWADYREHALEVQGVWWFIDKNGNPRNETIEELVQVLGFSIEKAEDMTDIDPDTLNKVAFMVQEEEYKDKVQHRAAWLRPYDSPAVGGAGISADKAKGLMQKHGSKLRAAFATARRASGGTPAPATKAGAAPPPAKKAATPPPAAAPATSSATAVAARVTSKEQAWAEVCSVYQAKIDSGDMTVADVEEKWREALAKVAGEREEHQLGPEDWQAITDDASIPF